MKIAINTLSVTPDKMGVKTYLTNLVFHLSKIDKINKYYLFLSRSNEVLFEDISRGNFRKIVLPISSNNRFLRIICEQIVLPFLVWRHKVEILFSPQNTSTLLTPSKEVLVVQLPYQYILQRVSRIKRIYYRIFLPISVKKVDRVIAVSEDLRKALIKDFNLSSKQIKVVYEGADLSHFSSTTQQDYRFEGLEKKRPYILFVSTLFDYKNADKLIEAFAFLKKKKSIVQNLVLVGKDPGSQVERLKKMVSATGVERNVYFEGKVPFKVIPFYYKKADVFVYPSRAETFGLPVLESMASGTPVVASNKASLPEVVGDAGVLVDPNDIEGLAKAIEKVIKDKKVRAELIEKGHERVENFSWEKTARATLKVFEEVYESG